MKIIGVAGRKGAGKDTFAQPLITNRWVQLRFADPLKAMLTVLLLAAGESRATVQRMLEGDLKEEVSQALCGRTPRHAMQTLGTEWREMISNDLWVRIAHNALKFHAKHGEQAVIVTDVRFVHEVAMLQSVGAYIVRVNRPIPRTRAFTDHPSEQGIDALPVDLDLFNNSSIAELHIMALRIADTTGQCTL